MIIDTHTHLNSTPLLEEIDGVIERAKANKVVAVFNTADNLESFYTIDDLQKRYPNFCYGVYGIHPDSASETNLDNLVQSIEARLPVIKAIGEIGLDYHYPLTSEEKERQKEVFIFQISLAKKYNLPIVIHARDADQDTFEILTTYAKDLKVDLHCYSGSKELALSYISKIPQIKFGIGGVLTFKNARRLVEVVEAVDISHLLTETDAPYLAPTPHRGQTNEPSFLPLVINKIAEIKNLTPEEIETFTYRNACEFYSL